VTETWSSVMLHMLCLACVIVGLLAIKWMTLVLYHDHDLTFPAVLSPPQSCIEDSLYT
jgi:hypothetical protein